jgi:hypothetical protein
MAPFSLTFYPCNHNCRTDFLIVHSLDTRFVIIKISSVGFSAFFRDKNPRSPVVFSLCAFLKILVHSVLFNDALDCLCFLTTFYQLQRLHCLNDRYGRQNVAVEWLAVLLRFRHVSDSNLSPKTGCPDWCFSWLSLVPTGKRWDSIVN